MTSVYLAGPITGLSWEQATAWRREAADYLRRHGVVARSPMRGQEFLAEEEIIKGCNKDSFLTSARACVTRDHYDVKHADLVICNFLGAYERISAGTLVEVGWASAIGTPIIAIGEEDNPHLHDFVRENCDWVVPTLRDALKIAVHVVCV